jgi:hypothetical protein
MPKTAPAFYVALDYAEERIQALIRSLDRPIDGFSPPCALAIGIARQAGAIYGDLMALARAGRLVSAMILLRPIVEAAILVRWIEMDPQPHADMYFAEDDRLRLGSAPAMVEFRRKRTLRRSGY